MSNMETSAGRRIGVAVVWLFLLGSLAGGYWFYRDRVTPDAQSPGENRKSGSVLVVTGKAGSEKMGFIEEEDVQALLRKKFGLEVNAIKAGSVEMVTDATAGLNFLWPASQVNVQAFASSGRQIAKADDIFNSPIVFYSWDIVTDALIAKGFVELRDGTYYVTDFPGLLQRMLAKTPWSEIGLPELYGTMTIHSTDPSKSNSGNMYAALLANTLNGGTPVATDALPEILPKLRDIFLRLGYMQHSSGVLFNMYLSQGVGAYPIIVGYENQIAEFAREHPETEAILKSRVRILYPRPTLWASHPFIALDDAGVRLLDALKDPALQALAWKQHGFRSAVMGLQNDMSAVSVVGLPKTITAVMPTPGAAAMSVITESLARQ